jgi:hypothetical protein
MIAVAAVLMVEVAIDEIVGVLAVGNAKVHQTNVSVERPTTMVITLRREDPD